MNEIEQHRRRADAAWTQFVRDARHFGDTVGLEVQKVKHLGAESVKALSVRHVLESHPLAIAGLAVGMGFVFGIRGAHRRATLRAIAQGASATIAGYPLSEPAPERPFATRVAEVVALAALHRGAQFLAARALDSLGDSSNQKAPIFGVDSPLLR